MSKLSDAGISWAIIGQVTPIKKATMPKREWVEEIVEAADKAGIPVFLKNNLYGLFPNDETLPVWACDKRLKYRQEFPE